MEHVRIFLSMITAEFHRYREALRQGLAPNVTVSVQEDFIATDTETLDKLDEYIGRCDAVIHLVGDMTSADAQPPSVAVIRQRMGGLVGAVSSQGVDHCRALGERPRGAHYQRIEARQAAQRARLARPTTVERYPEIRFANTDRPAAAVLRSVLLDILIRAGTVSATGATVVVAIVIHGMGGVDKTRYRRSRALI